MNPFLKFPARSLCVVLLLLTVGPAHAVRSGGVAVHLSVHAVIKQSDGSVLMRPAETAKPGDILEYRAIYTNTSKGDLKGVEATLPVPAGGMYYLRNSVLPATSLASLDGNVFERVPLKRTVTLPDGRQEMREVPTTEYRYLRWALGDMAAGQSITVSARMRVPLTPANTVVAEAKR